MKRLIIYLICIVTLSISAEAQRRITPVTPQNGQTTEKKEKFDKSRLVEFKDESGNIVLVDTVSGKEYVDTTEIKETNKIEYPLLHEATFGLNFWDPVMRCLGQKYGGAEVWAELSLYNRFKPVVELGFGSANSTPEDKNFTYKSSMAPYFRIGMNYNFLFKKITDYQFLAGLKYGFTSFSYELNNISMDAGYWGEPINFNIPSQKSTVGFMELTFGIKVKIYQNISMGWALKYHAILHESKNKYGDPWYIPGYGTRGSSITGAFLIMYTIPFKKKETEIVDIETEEELSEKQNNNEEQL